ncbi:MAG: hypothetical protein M1820_009171 [Bogoriella megaspora]|nr:MAG: hypothetical protein M1820_009171 [Bogoriella megaspora]
MSNFNASGSNKLPITISVLSLIASFVFGPWAISSLNAAKAGNDLAQQSLEASVTATQQTQVQNIIALWSLCISSTPSAPVNQSLCVELYETHPFPSIIATVTRGQLPAPPPPPPPPSLPPNKTLVTQEYIDALVVRLTSNRKLLTEGSLWQLKRTIGDVMPDTTWIHLILIAILFLLCIATRSLSSFVR